MDSTPKCPICDMPATNQTRRTNPQGVVVANYVCAREHGWETRWVSPVWPAVA